MGWLFLINGLGLLGTAVYAGLAFGEDWTPGWALAAAGVFMTALVLPFALEYRSVRRDYRRIGGEFLSEVRKPYFPDRKGEAQVFAGDAGRISWTRRAREPLPVAIVLAAVGLAMLGVDAWQFADFLAVEKPPADRTISNF